MNKIFIGLLLILVALIFASGQKTDADKKNGGHNTKKCFTAATREAAERVARVYHTPDPGYDPVLGYDPANGPRKGSPPVDENGMTKPVACRANPNPTKGHGTLPKYYCSVEGNVDDDGDLIRYKVKGQHKGAERDARNGEINGEFLSSRFSQTMGFYADDEWVADVTCPDCEKSLTRQFIGVKYTPFQPAAGIEMKDAQGIDTDCDNDKGASLSGSLKEIAANGEPRAEVDAFKLWLAFIDHGDTKDDNHRFACLHTTKAANGTLSCSDGQAIFYVSDMGSTFGYSSDSSKKARLDLWQGKDPIKVEGGKCSSTAKSIGDARVSEAGRALLAANLQRLLDAEAQNGLITRVFKASRNDERDKPAAAWTAEFIRKAKTIINAHCSD